MTVTLHLGDCLEIVPTFAPQSVDAIITDIPYGTTACKWDTVIPFPDLWRIVKHVLKPRGAFVTTASQPFTSALVMSNPVWFKYCLTWNKKKGGSPLLSKIQPIRITEDVIIFSDGKITYNPIMTPREKPKSRGKNKGNISKTTNNSFTENKTYTEYYPKNIIEFTNANQHERVHPTQKPVALYEYLIKTYTNEGDTVLDFTMGSGTTGVSCVNTGRKFIGVEKEPDYFAIAEKRIAQAQAARQLEFVT